MKLLDVKKRQKVRNQYAETLTVLEVIGDLMVRTYEEPNDLYHYTKLFVNGQSLQL